MFDLSFYRMLIHEARIGLVLVDMDGHYIDFNREYQELIGYSLEEAKKLSYWKITPQKYKHFEKRLLECIRTTGEYGPFVKEYVHKDRGLVPVRLYLKRVADSNGNEYIWSSVQPATLDELRLSLALLPLLGPSDAEDDSDLPFAEKPF